MKVDLVMWTKNGAATLPQVLKRIDEVVPAECVNQKLIVDDKSTDGTCKIAEAQGWMVIPNAGSGISDGANTALKHVETEYFVSFEQDLLLARDWWMKIPPLLENPKVAVASGMRFASQPVGVKKLQQYVAKKYRGEAFVSSWLSSRKAAAFTLGKTLDNTIYKTSVLEEVGGFPFFGCNAGVDTVLAYRLAKLGYEWIVGYNVQSVHLRRGLIDELRHQYNYGTQLSRIWRVVGELGFKSPVSFVGLLQRLVTSPATGVFVALKTREPSIAYIHPLVRLYYTLGFLRGRRIPVNPAGSCSFLISAEACEELKATINL